MSIAAERRRARELRDWQARQMGKARTMSAPEDYAEVSPDYDYMIPDEYYGGRAQRDVGCEVRNDVTEECAPAPCPWTWEEVLAGAWKEAVTE